MGTGSNRCVPGGWLDVPPGIDARHGWMWNQAIHAGLITMPILAAARSWAARRRYASSGP